VSNHRADKRAVKRRSVDVRGTSEPLPAPVLDPAPLERAAHPATEPVQRSTGGKRRAVKPGRTVSREPRRQSSTHDRRRKTLIPGFPPAPTLIGIAALALAAAGAVTVSSPDSGSQLASGNIQKLSAQASVLSGSSTIGSSNSLSGRARAVSRDSQREAMRDAADQNLLAAAEKQAKKRNAALAALAASAEKQATLIAKNAWQLPVDAGVYHLTSRFGECSTLWSHCHTGLDFAAPSGTPIHAIAGGVVTSVGYDGSYGNKTVVTLEDGTELWYCHQTSYAVTTGDNVTAGEVIGSVGSTGNVTGPHVHIEVRPGAGDPVDPYAAMLAHGLNP
jgi:murein DD-endopeptidase MepM/ murein hydrolase activator NlpD